jgi:hypothetical protein
VRDFVFLDQLVDVPGRNIKQAGDFFDRHRHGAALRQVLTEDTMKVAPQFVTGLHGLQYLDPA